MNIEQKAREVALDLPLMHIAGSVEAPISLWTNVIAAALQSAVADEREECAKELESILQIEEGHLQGLTGEGRKYKIFQIDDLKEYAAAIRARGQKAEETAKESK